MPAFTTMWGRLLAARPHGVCPATWWELTAKPACRSFCINYSKQAAHRRRELSSFLLQAIQRAQVAGNWAAVHSLRGRLSAMAAHRLAGRAVRAHLAPGAAVAAAPVFQFAAEANSARAPPAPLHLSAGGRVLTDPAAIAAEITGYFGALFQGRHVTTADRPEPFDSGRPFEPDFQHFQDFVRDIPAVDQFQAATMDLPLNLPELEFAAASAASGKAPGLDGLPYEFYRRTMHLVGPSLLEALNTMLERGALTPSLQLGAVRLLPKVAGVPAASQLRPITLLSCDYKLMTKIYVQRLLPILPTVLTTHQLCSVRGRSIFDGCTALLSVVEACHRERRPGFLINLDFFHAYDRVCMSYVDRVLAAMGFGDQFRAAIRTLHRGARAVFLLDEVSEEVEVEFSIRQGDPIATLIFTINMEPFLSALHRYLPGITIGQIKEQVEAYMDDVDAVGQREADLHLIDRLSRLFEAMSGQILNRNRKTAILGLGTWAGRQDWPLRWLSSPPTLKVFGVTFAPSLALTITASWEACSRGVLAAISFWSGRFLPTIRLKRDALEAFIFSKLWYLCQVLPLPAQVAQRLAAAAGTYLWRGHLERLAWQELHSPLAAGGLALSCLRTRAQALLAKQFCWAVGNGGKAAAHWAFWLGNRLGEALPGLAGTPQARSTPPCLARSGRRSGRAAGV